MPLQGTFDVLDFTEVLRLLSRLQATGRLHVRNRSFGANLFLEEGLLVGADQSEHQPAATVGDVRGRIEEICFEMLEAERGGFEFTPGKPSAVPVSDRHRAESVLSRARKRLDEWHALQETIPSLELQPRLVVNLEIAEVTIDKERWRMLTAIDGRRNLRAIGRALNLSDFDVCRVVQSLMRDGIVELEGLAALPASTRDAMPVVPAPDASGIEAVLRDLAGVDRPPRADLPTLPPLPAPGPLVTTERVARDRGTAEASTPDPGAPAPLADPAPEAPAGESDPPAPGGSATQEEPTEASGEPAPPGHDDVTGESPRRSRRVIRIRSRQPD